jgi:hypothetical protein
MVTFLYKGLYLVSVQFGLYKIEGFKCCYMMYPFTENWGSKSFCSEKSILYIILSQWKKPPLAKSEKRKNLASTFE